MKRSRKIEVFLAVSVASILSGCGQTQTGARGCADETNVPADRRNCEGSQSSSAHIYHWVGTGGGARETSGTSRGVIGAEGAAHGGGGEGGGE